MPYKPDSQNEIKAMLTTTRCFMTFILGYFRFDVAGAGACLKRYTDPSFFKVETVPDNIPTVEVQREKKVRKTKVLQ